MEFYDLRSNYGVGSIPDSDSRNDPFEWLNVWLQQALDSGEPEANAMALSTVSEKGMPSSRIVLLKALEDNGLLFYTNYSSRKGVQLSGNPQAALLFFWPGMERQVRIEGHVEKTEEELSDAYFYSRPFASQVSAVISPQSQVIASRTILEEMHREILEGSNPDKLIRPSEWGGYRIIPILFEFWQGRSDRLHDRIQFTREGLYWKKSRLAP